MFLATIFQIVIILVLEIVVNNRDINFCWLSILSAKGDSSNNGTVFSSIVGVAIELKVWRRRRGGPPV
jgi:hypothetical protein